MSTGGASQDFAANSRSSGPYSSGFRRFAILLSHINSPMRQHAATLSIRIPVVLCAASVAWPARSTDASGVERQYATAARLPRPSRTRRRILAPSPSPVACTSRHRSKVHHRHSSSRRSSLSAAALEPQWRTSSFGVAATVVATAAGPGGNLLRASAVLRAIPWIVLYGGIAGKQQDDDMDDDDAGNYDDYDGKGKVAAAMVCRQPTRAPATLSRSSSACSDDKAYESVVAWSPSGDSFCGQRHERFHQARPPRNFRHSNFASFVRQLNKYDFHKVKNPEDGSGTVGEHVWEFQHPDFVRGREDLLENVKRKIPAKKKPNTKVASSTANRDDSPSMMPAPMMDAHAKMGESDADLRMQVAHLTALQDQMQNHVLALTKQYQGVIERSDVSEEHGAARSAHAESDSVSDESRAG